MSWAKRQIYNSTGARSSSRDVIGRLVKVRYCDPKSGRPHEYQGRALRKGNLHGWVFLALKLENGTEKLVPFPSRPKSIEKYRFEMEVL